MPFIEITPNRLQQSDPNSKFRLLMDSQRQMNIHIWLDKEDHPIRFQISDNSNILEWKNGQGIKTGKVDDGSQRQMNIKASPLMILSTNQNKQIIADFQKKIHYSLAQNNTNPAVIQAINTILRLLDS